MNLRLFLSVLGRFRLVVAGGALVGIALATLSIARVSFDGYEPRLQYRAAERWQSNATLLMSQPGFPWGRSVLDEIVPLGKSGELGYIPRYGDGNRFAWLAALYSKLAKGDEVRAIMLRDGPVHGQYDTATVQSEFGAGLPLLTIAGFGGSPEQAEEIARRATNAFLVFLKTHQDANRIPAESRVQLQIVEKAGQAVRVEGRRLMKPIFFFVLVMSATVLLAFALENLYPRRRLTDEAAAVRPTPVPEPSRKTA